jgi:hypothetical protein
VLFHHLPQKLPPDGTEGAAPPSLVSRIDIPATLPR